jgi:hypothetical protein
MIEMELPGVHEEGNQFAATAPGFDEQRCHDPQRIWTDGHAQVVRSQQAQPDEEPGKSGAHSASSSQNPG